MTILAWILVGLIAGLIANAIYPGSSRGGWLGAMALGIVGAIVGGFVAGILTGYDFVTGVNFMTIVVAVLGALILLFAYNALAGRGHGGTYTR
jgi:uncharacterized membrane protein YeaQ/YmgE (transglycosylase-associated protein family)